MNNQPSIRGTMIVDEIIDAAHNHFDGLEALKNFLEDGAEAVCQWLSEKTRELEDAAEEFGYGNFEDFIKDHYEEVHQLLVDYTIDN